MHSFFRKTNFLILIFFASVFVFAEEVPVDGQLLSDEDMLLKEEVLAEEDFFPEESEYQIPEDNIILPEPERVPLEFKGAEHALTKKYIERFLTNSGRAILAKSLEASSPYRPYIRNKLKEKNMPLMLQYLPVVESNYKITAVSRTGATGMWQFMENSMHPFLKKNSWYDERLDPWKSTDAALLKLTDNYKMFGDWLIAIAAYNCGAGAMKKVLKQNPGADFWYLAEHGKLRSQTAEYVPKLLAIYEVVENAEHYGALEVGLADSLIADSLPENYAFVAVRGMYSMNQIAEATGIERQTLDFLNPSLIRHCTPAGEIYSLRVPEGMGKVVEEKLSKLGMPSDALVHKVVKGDSLWAISRRYGVTVQDLCTLNNIRENGILSIGQVLIVPIFK